MTILLFHLDFLISFPHRKLDKPNLIWLVQSNHVATVENILLWQVLDLKKLFPGEWLW